MYQLPAMVWHALLQLLRAVWYRLCSLRFRRQHDKHDSTAEQTERQQLLPFDAPASASVSPEPHAIPAQPLLPCTIIVMRHGHRQVEWLDLFDYAGHLLSALRAAIEFA